MGPLVWRKLLVWCVLLACDRTSALAARRVKINKYQKFSKADAVRDSLRFSNIDEGSGSGLGEEGGGSQPASAVANAPKKRASWAYPDSAHVDQRDPTTFGFTEIGIVLGAHGTRGELKVRSDSDFARERLCQPGVTWLRRPRRRAPRETRVLRGRKGPGSDAYLITLETVRTREDAMALQGATLFVRRELRPSLCADEMMLWELEGLAVVRAERDTDCDDEQPAWSAGQLLGTIVGVIPREELTGSRELGHDLLEVALAAQGETDARKPHHQPGRPDGGAEEADEQAEEEVDEAEEGEDASGEPETVLVPFVPQIVVSVQLGEQRVLLDPPEGLLELICPKRSERVVIRGLLPMAPPDEA